MMPNTNPSTSLKLQNLPVAESGGMFSVVVETPMQVQAAPSALTTKDIEALFRQYQRHIFRFVQRYVRNAEDAEDVVQNTFMEAVRCADRFSSLSKPSTWLFGIALNLARSQVRSNYANKCDVVEEGFIEQIVDTHADPAHLIELREIASKVDALLGEMPARIRATFESVLEGDSTYEQAAEQLQIPIGTVRSRVSRVRATVRSNFM
jgi:RNA polymerase sigma-70 factor (ECF subfamily)